MKTCLIALLLMSLPATVFAAEAEANPIETKLREALRNTMLQLRDAQGQIANLQAADVANTQKITDLDKQVETLTRQAIEDRNASTNMISDLKTQLEEQKVVTLKLEATVADWKRAYSQATALATKKEAERAKAAAQVIKLDRVVADQQVKNIEMFKMGMEVLDRYEKFGLGDALLAREPFVGTTRVKFQNLMQAYQDKLADQRIQPAPTP